MLKLKIGKLNGLSRKLLIIFMVLFAVFLLAGGFSALDAYMNGAKTYMQYLNSTLAPLASGCILIGAYGLVFAYKNKDRSVCLVGFFITFICYFFLEYLFRAVGGV